jgi:beta-lactamase regulating signal transducer with metallopeptidase domain
MIHLSLKTAAELLALRSLDSLLEGSAVCLAAAAILRVMRRQNAAARFAVWFSALLSITAIPVLNGIWSPSAGVVSEQHAVISVSGSWALYFFSIWAVVAFVLFLRLAWSLYSLQILRRSCTEVGRDSLDPGVKETLQKHGAKRKVKLCTSRRVSVPAAIGLWKPAVVLPEWAITELSAGELNQIVLHELAHLRRWDDWTNLAQQIVRALFFFHPAIWWIDKKATLEREIACDDAVLAETARPRAYAQCLARLAEKSFAHRSLALAQAALGKVRQMSTRVAQILDANRPAPSGSVWRPVASVATLFVIACAAWFTNAPKLISFEDGDPSHAAVSVARVPGAAPSAVPLPTTSPAKVIPAGFSQKPEHQPVSTNKRATTKRAVARMTHGNELVHYTAAKSPAVPFTQTMWIVVETNQPVENGSVLQIQMWHVTILQSPAGNPTPQKI